MGKRRLSEFTKGEIYNLFTETVLSMEKEQFGPEDVMREMSERHNIDIEESGNFLEYIKEKMDFFFEMGFIGKTRLYYFPIP